MLNNKSLVSKIFTYGFVSLLLLFIFSLYFAPDMMIAITNQVWALCGW